MGDAIPLFCSKPPCKLIASSIDYSLSKKSSLEYTTCIYLFPGYKGDNVSLLTGQYVLIDQLRTTQTISGLSDSKITYLEPEYIYGAPSYIQALRSMIPDAMITFTPVNESVGTLKIERLV